MNPFPSKALFCVTGLTPQIVTETLYALCVMQQPAWVPDVVVVVTTLEGKKRILEQLLAAEGGQFSAFCASYGLQDRIVFNEGCVHLANAANGDELDDVRSEQDNILIGDAISHAVQALVAGYDEVHVSIAGGRKTMGYYAGCALSMYGRPQDRMSHVLVNEPFEQAPAFYFPPAIAMQISLRDHTTVSTSKASVTLADMPFLRLGHFLPAALKNEKMSFQALVLNLQSQLNPASVHLDALSFTLNTAAGEIRLAPQPFAVYAWFAMIKNRRFGFDGAFHASHDMTRQYFLPFVEMLCSASPKYDLMMRRLRDEIADAKVMSQFFSEKLSAAHKTIDSILGSQTANRYKVVRGGRVRGNELRSLPLEAQAISLCDVLDAFANKIAGKQTLFLRDEKRSIGR